ncbi:unnamed protein product [Polarella glacialis]|uniref:Tetratricopeptide repeat protein 38 n=1 Tax=Polarella glacialis TaxID=89957 RepID=A0A813GTS3_POLGL|nr:unnamed protein product [Polarella glacialis]
MCVGVQHDVRLGEVPQTFPVSSVDVNAIAWFKYGLLQLFSFGYDYAGPAFVKSRENDPKFALAYAFEALNNFWPVWGKDDLAASNAIFSSMPGDATANHHEQLYIDAIRAHFNTSLENDTEARLSEAVTAIALVTESHPGDSTGLALLGLWRLVLSAEQAGAAAQSSISLADSNLKSALAIDPRHPAALHYQLHLYDSLDAAVAAKGLPAATLYPEVAQDASHGLHMPVHIQLRLANYTACFAADSLALQAADATCALYGLAGDEGCNMWNLYHSLEYLQFTGYQIGRWKDAMAMNTRMSNSIASAAAKQHPQLASLMLWFMRMDAREILDRAFVMLPQTQLLDVAMNCTNPEELVPGFWTSHTESGATLAHGLCQVFKFRPSADEANPQRVALSALRARFVEVPGEYGWEEPTNLSPWYIYQVNLMHVAMLDAADFFVQAQDSVNCDAKQSLFTQAWAHAANATSIEDVLVPVADSPTILFMSAHELYGMLLLMTGEKAHAAMASMAFAKARSSQGPQLATRLGQARAKALAGLPCEAAAWYEEVLAMMDQASDKADLPFWAELQQGLAMCQSPEDMRQRGAVLLSFNHSIEVFSNGQRGSDLPPYNQSTQPMVFPALVLLLALSVAACSLCGRLVRQRHPYLLCRKEDEEDHKELICQSESA